jgi:outer membrane protein OmpA-like peptidoglycan-associated protein
MPSTRKSFAASGAIAALLLTGACTTNPETGQQQMSRAGSGALIGSGAGALLGAILGGRNNRTEVLVGTGIGAIAGAGIGTYMDNQEKKLREQTAGTGIEVDRQGDDIVLKMPDNVTFDFNSAVLRPEFRPAVQSVAQTLVQYPSTFIDVYGHTDSIGSAAVNQRLSEQRAKTVAATLQTMGVQGARIETRGFGYTMPVASNDSEAGRAQNRRVEIRLSPVTEGDVASSRQM